MTRKSHVPFFTKQYKNVKILCNALSHQKTNGITLTLTTKQHLAFQTMQFVIVYFKLNRQLMFVVSKHILRSPRFFSSLGFATYGARSLNPKRQKEQLSGQKVTAILMLKVHQLGGHVMRSRKNPLHEKETTVNIVSRCINPCAAEANFAKPKNIQTFERAVQILHCDNSF